MPRCLRHTVRLDGSRVGACGTAGGSSACRRAAPTAILRRMSSIYSIAPESTMMTIRRCDELHVLPAGRISHAATITGTAMG
jgi:hypothetical protein